MTYIVAAQAQQKLLFTHIEAKTKRETKKKQSHLSSLTVKLIVKFFLWRCRLIRLMCSKCQFWLRTPLTAINYLESYFVDWHHFYQYPFETHTEYWLVQWKVNHFFQY